MGSRVRHGWARSGDWKMQVGLRRIQAAAGRSHGSPGWAQRPFEVGVRQSATQEHQVCRGFRRPQAQIQDRQRQRRVVPGVVVGVWQRRAVVFELKGQCVVVLMSLARLVNQGVLDLQ